MSEDLSFGKYLSQLVKDLSNAEVWECRFPHSSDTRLNSGLCIFRLLGFG